MKHNTKPEITKMKSIQRAAIITGLVLMLPLVAMQFSDEVNWGIQDFIAIGLLVFITGFIYEFFVKRIANSNHRKMVGVALFALLAIIWVELAVGIFD